MSDKYKKEIEDILKQVGETAPAPRRRQSGPSVWRLIWVQLVQSLGGRSWSLTPGRVMLLAVALLIGALIVRGLVPGLVAPLAWAGLILFIVGYGLFLVRPRRIEKRWRGQVVDDEPRSRWDRFRNKLR